MNLFNLKPVLKKNKEKSFRLRRKGNLKIFYAGLTKDDIINSKLITNFKTYNTIENKDGCLLCVDDNIDTYVYASNFIINGVKGMEIDEHEDELLNFNINPVKTNKHPQKHKIQHLYNKEDLDRTISINNDNMDIDDSNEKNVFECNVESKDDKIKRLEDNCICLFEMVKKINRKLRNIELKYSDEIEISLSGEPNKEIVTEHNKDTFYSQNNAEVDSAFEKDYALTMENLKKGFMTSSFFGHTSAIADTSSKIDKINEKADEKRELYKDVKIVEPRRKKESK